MFRLMIASEDDLEEIVDLRRESVHWLRTQGTDQWAALWPTAEAQRARLLTSIKSDETWIVRDGLELVATFAVDRYSDPRLWTSQEQAEPALYVHRLIVRRGYAGIGLGREIYQWIAAWGRRHGYGWLRVDVWTTNTRLQQYYREAGFQHVRTVQVRSESTGAEYPSGALFQRSTDEKETRR